MLARILSVGHILLDDRSSRSRGTAPCRSSVTDPQSFNDPEMDDSTTSEKAKELFVLRISTILTVIYAVSWHFHRHHL